MNLLSLPKRPWIYGLILKKDLDSQMVLSCSILDLLAEFDCNQLPSASSPLDPCSMLSADSAPLLTDPILYRRIVGKLNYLTHTRIDLSFSILILSQFMQRPCVGHFSVALGVVSYLRLDSGQGFVFEWLTTFLLSCLL